MYRLKNTPGGAGRGCFSSFPDSKVFTIRLRGFSELYIYETDCKLTEF